MIQGAVLIPTTFDGRTYVTDRYSCLFEMLRDHLEFQIIVTDDPNRVPSNVDVVLTLKNPQPNVVSTLVQLADLDPQVKLIGYFTDLHLGDKEPYHSSMIRMLERCDVVLCPYDEMFRKTWPQFVDKYVFFPHFFAPHERFARLSFNEDPVMKCVLAGAIGHVYPLRCVISQYPFQGEVFIPQHPGYYTKKWDDAVFVRDRYARLLHDHFCSVATSSVYNYVVAKYFEIPATGALLLANEVEDLKKLDFVPFVHYIPITADDVVGRIQHCLLNPEEYIEIRRTGMKFVREEHSINNRFEQLRKILEVI